MALIQPSEVIDLTILRVEDPVVGPGERTSVRVHVLNSGTATAFNVTLALSDGSEKGPDGIVLRSLGDMPPASIKSTTLSLTYSITDSLRLGALNVAAYSRQHPIDIDYDGIRRSAALEPKPVPLASRTVKQ